MVSQHFNQIIFQQTISTADRVSVPRHMSRIDLSLLGKSSLLCKLNEVGFALPLKPGVRHGVWYGLSRANAAIKMV